MKKNKFNLLLLALIVSIMFSCKEENKEEVVEVEDTVEVESETAAAEPAEIVFETPELQTAFDRYLALKDAFVESNPEEVREVAVELEEAFNNLEKNESLLEALEKIQNAENINVQRDAFAVVSAEMENIIQGQVKSGVVYKQYCPMAFDGEGGHWLAASDEIRNPYYGDKMLKCGTVKATIE